MRKAAHPSGSMGSSNPLRWRGEWLQHHGDVVCYGVCAFCAFSDSWLVSRICHTYVLEVSKSEPPRRAPYLDAWWNFLYYSYHRKATRQVFFCSRPNPYSGKAVNQLCVSLINFKIFVHWQCLIAINVRELFISNHGISHVHAACSFNVPTRGSVLGPKSYSVC